MLYNYYELYGKYWQDRAPGEGIQAKANYLRQKMKNYGITPALPMMVTETGEPSTWIGDKAQARCLNMLLVRGIAARLEAVVWWTFRDFPNNAPPPQDTWKYGVVEYNGLVAKPAYNALKTLGTELQGFDYVKTLSGDNGFSGVEAYRFEDGGAAKVILWSSAIKPANYSPKCAWDRVRKMATLNATNLRIVSFTGSEKMIADNSKKDKDKTVGKIKIGVGRNPRIVEINP
jgi:hypothetical protein